MADDRVLVVYRYHFPNCPLGGEKIDSTRVIQQLGGEHTLAINGFLPPEYEWPLGWLAGLSGAGFLVLLVVWVRAKIAPLPAASSGANFEFASLRSCKLKGANLSGARFDGSVIETTDFENANLEGARLNGVQLVASPLETATVKGTRFAGTLVLIHVAAIRHAFGKIVPFGLRCSFCATCRRIADHARRIRFGG